MAEPGAGDLVVEPGAALQRGDYVQILDHALDAAGGNPPFGQVGGSLPVGGLLVAQAGAGAGVFAPEDLQRVSVTDIPRDVLADIHRRSGLADPESSPAT